MPTYFNVTSIRKAQPATLEELRADRLRSLDHRERDRAARLAEIEKPYRRTIERIADATPTVTP